MMTYLVIGLCLFLLIVVVYISAKPISMGIEARRNIKDSFNDKEENSRDYYDKENTIDNSISDEIIKLKELKDKGILTDKEYVKAKEKLLN